MEGKHKSKDKGIGKNLIKINKNKENYSNINTELLKKKQKEKKKEKVCPKAQKVTILQKLPKYIFYGKKIFRIRIIRL